MQPAPIRVPPSSWVPGRMTVSRQLQRDGSTFVARLPKYGSERVVHLPDELMEMLRLHIERFLPEEPPPDAWLFTVGDGPRNRVTIAKGFRNVVTLGHGRKNRVTVTGAKATCSLPHVSGLRQSATARHYRDTVVRCRVVTR